MDKSLFSVDIFHWEIFGAGDEIFCEVSHDLRVPDEV